ncbi:MAG: TIGR02171 family protein [Fibrobacter sp.]|nr:TIGR02171 family protein [Fibrobacter sp.]
MKYLWTFFLSLFVVACSNSESAQSIEQVSSEEPDAPIEKDSVPTSIEIEGMIHLENGSTTIGSNDKSFKANERPAMKVLLDYDFYMGIHEVTCGEYANVAKKNKLKTFDKCENDSLPLVNVTYYDAILYVNAKSKLNEYDTAYTYTKAIYDTEGHCTNLEGFAFHAEAKAFRLPTEAEWVYAATRAWDVKKSWNSENSDYKLHPICSKGADSTGFCDMAGNAMEWVNDWLGQFHDTTVTNYAGAPDGGDLGERILKGGRYSSSPKELNPYSRGDVYTVTSSTRAEYVGFRLVFGAIPNALWMNDDGISTSIVTPLVGSEAIKHLAGTYNAKLAFRNDISGNISYLDYKNGTLSIKEITQEINAFHPEISPNGKWIAFCTGFEGVAGKSTIYVQSLENDTIISIKLKAESAAIPRWQVLESGDTVIVFVNDAGNNKDEATFKVNSTWQVKFANGKFGTPQKLFDGAYHGGLSEDRTLAVSGARILRARVAEKDSTITDKANDDVWYDSAQACNVSLSQDGTKRTIFLDFAGKPGKKFAGENYSTHERIFIADSNGKLIQSIKAPTGYTFDHTEWATDGEKSIIVATLTNANGAHTKIALVDPADSSITEIAEGDELWHPTLWIKKKVKPILSSSSNLAISSSSAAPDSIEINSSSSIIPPEPEFGLDLDSAGAYYVAGGIENALIMRYKMELLWTYYDSANVVILGSSRSKNGIIPAMFNDSIKAINLAVSDFSINEAYYVYKNYIASNVKNLKYLIVSLDIDMWWKEYASTENFFYQEYKNYPGYIYDINHNFWKDNIPSDLQEATYDCLGAASKNFNRQTLGFSSFAANGWRDNPSIVYDSTWNQQNPELFNASLNYLDSIIHDAHDKNIYVIGVIFPQSPAYKNTGSYGAYGLTRSEAPALIDRIRLLSDSLPNFIVFDENKMGDHDYPDEMARDGDHLATPGAEQMTHRLDSLIQTLNIDFENSNQPSDF